MKHGSDTTRQTPWLLVGLLLLAGCEIQEDRATCLNGGVPDAACRLSSDPGVTEDVPVTTITRDELITRACNAGSPSGIFAECGWRFAASYQCAPSTVITIGCTGKAFGEAGIFCGGHLGSCSGDPMIRVCAGLSDCNSASRLAALRSSSGTGFDENDACGLCPVAQYICPTSGTVSVYERSVYTDEMASCIVGYM